MTLNDSYQGIHSFLCMFTFSVQFNQIIVFRTQGHDLSD